MATGGDDLIPQSSNSIDGLHQHHHHQHNNGSAHANNTNGSRAETLSNASGSGSVLMHTAGMGGPATAAASSSNAMHNGHGSHHMHNGGLDDISKDIVLMNGGGPPPIGRLMMLENRDRPVPGGGAGIGMDSIDDGLGPLPSKWEKAYTESGEAYFIDHNTGTSHWLDPRLSKFQKKSLEDCMDDELPYGWEKIHDPQYGTYFIDHVNRRTQYENPVLEAKRRVERSRGTTPKLPPYTFTRNPSELCGERITTTLLKSSRGLGFTIVGGDDNVDEFLQIKSIVPNGPAWLDGKLCMGDILVYVNDTCVLGFTHHEMVNVFQSILPGETVTLEVCRGYPLPFDPNDPNTEVVTTIAVDGISADPEKARILMDLNMDGNYNFLDHSDSAQHQDQSDPVIGQKNPLAKLHQQRDELSWQHHHEMMNTTNGPPELLCISISKGIMGFGFTIADSVYGQKVKKILDRNCCKNLMEGDILLAINNIILKHMSHSEVVQVLKDCPKNLEASLKVQRGHGSSGSLIKSNKLRKAKDQAGALFRSKTPTADFHSQQAKEVLPIRPKTPLVDTRTRAKTPDECDNLDKITSLDDSKSVDAKSTNSYPDHDSINNDIPYMDPLPKLVSTLSDRLAEASLQDPQNNLYAPADHGMRPSVDFDHAINQADYYSQYVNSPAISLYATSSGLHMGGGQQMQPPQSMPLMAPVPTYHQDPCFCLECQDVQRMGHMNANFNGGNQDPYQQAHYQQQQYQQQQQQHQESSVYHQQNGRIQKRINEYIVDRRKAGFSPLESHLSPTQHMQQQPQLGYWKSPDESQFTLSEVTLERQALGFGFRIVGGTEEGSQVTVGHIVPGGAADGDPRINTGDEILSIDGMNVVNASHHRVVQLMGEAAHRGQVTMILRRRGRQLQQAAASGGNTIRYPYDVIVSRSENEGFGFVIISSSSQYYGSTIGKLIPGSPADRCGDIKVGDRIIAVNRIDISGMGHGDVVNLIKESGLHVRLTIGNPKEMAPQQTLPAIGNAGKNDPYFERFPIGAQHPQL